MAQLHVTRVRREFREIVTSEEVRRGGRREGEGGGEEGGRWRLEGGGRRGCDSSRSKGGRYKF